MKATTSFNSLRTGAVCALFACGALSAQAAPINYGDFSDVPPGGVMYTDVTETANTVGDDEPLYGPPEITVNTLDFDPAGFSADSTDGDSDITDGQLNFGFMTPQGAGLNGLTIRESGDFTLFGGGSTATSVAAGLFAEVEITHVNQLPLLSPISVIASTQFSTDLGTSPGLNQPWSNSLFVDFGPALSNAGFGAGDYATKGEIVLNDTLVAISEDNPSTIAFIAKKDFKLIPVGDLTPDDVIPEPTTAVLAGLALAGLAARRR